LKKYFLIAKRTERQEMHYGGYCVKIVSKKSESDEIVGLHENNRMALNI
jgi:hypothetical protein